MQWCWDYTVYCEENGCRRGGGGRGPRYTEDRSSAWLRWREAWMHASALLGFDTLPLAFRRRSGIREQMQDAKRHTMSGRDECSTVKPTWKKRCGFLEWSSRCGFGQHQAGHWPLRHRAARAPRRHCRTRTSISGRAGEPLTHSSPSSPLQCRPESPTR